MYSITAGSCTAEPLSGIALGFWDCHRDEFWVPADWDIVLEEWKGSHVVKLEKQKVE
jgi:hypothetical protein